MKPSVDITKETLDLKELINKADLDGIRKFHAQHPLVCDQVQQFFWEKYKFSLTPPIKRLIEALRGIKEGSLADNEAEMTEIMKNYVPPDQNLRQMDWYRKNLGGAWILWELGNPWRQVIPDGLMWSRAWVCPLSEKTVSYPVPDLSFSPLNTHKIVKCEQVIETPNGPALIDGRVYNSWSDKEKIRVGKSPQDL